MPKGEARAVSVEKNNLFWAPSSCLKAGGDIISGRTVTYASTVTDGGWDLIPVTQVNVKHVTIPWTSDGYVLYIYLFTCFTSNYRQSYVFTESSCREQLENIGREGTASSDPTRKAYVYTHPNIYSWSCIGNIGNIGNITYCILSRG